MNCQSSKLALKQAKLECMYTKFNLALAKDCHQSLAGYDFRLLIVDESMVTFGLLTLLGV